ncbi:ATP-dependent helicase, partial [Lactobacillus delbrueckii subsp. lactis]|nr:ATP-dependent helicase [Lactobacillus delbrueckii subsp. lactis]
MKKQITPNSKVSVAAACFSIYAYQALKDELEKCSEFRFIFTSPTFVPDQMPKERREFYIPRITREKSLYGTEFEVRLRNELKQNEFTTVGLGCERGNTMINITTRLDNPASQAFLDTFESMWQDKEKMVDVTDEIIDKISSVYQENSPELIYFMTLYNVFSEFLADVSEDVLPNEATG